MKWLKRVALGLGVLAALGALVFGYLWWRMHQEPDDFANAAAVDPAEAERVLADMNENQAPDDDGRPEPWGTRGGWGRKRPPAKGAPPSRPYRIALTDRQVAALVSRHVMRGGGIGEVRVAVRDRDLFAAGRLTGTALAGSVVSITAVPSAGSRGRLCLALGQARVGGQAIPQDLLEQLGAQAGQKIPRSVCMNARGAGLPGPVTNVRIANGKVVVEGMR